MTVRFAKTLTLYKEVATGAMKAEAFGGYQNLKFMDELLRDPPRYQRGRAQQVTSVVQGH